MNKTALVTFLMAHGVPLSEWGKGKARSVNQLLEEIESSEAEINAKEGKVIRTIQVVLIDIFFLEGERPLKLFQDRQEFKDGRVERRDYPSSVSEKVRGFESPIQAALRGLREELGITTGVSLDLVPPDIEPSEPSIHFPGIETQRKLFKYEVILPKELFKPDGYVEVQKDKTNYFVWKEIPQA
jgi:hypothetical protein